MPFACSVLKEKVIYRQSSDCVLNFLDYIPHLVVLHVVKSQRRSLKEENRSIHSSQAIQELVHTQQFHQYIYSEIILD